MIISSKYSVSAISRNYFKVEVFGRVSYALHGGFSNINMNININDHIKYMIYEIINIKLNIKIKIKKTNKLSIINH